MSHLEIFKLAQFKKNSNHKFKFFNNKWENSSKNLCKDKCSIYIEKVFPQVKNIHIVQEGCILSRAATNALIGSIEDKSLDEAHKIILDFKKMLSGEILDTILPPKLLVFKKFSKFPSRISCLLVGANLLLKTLEKRIIKK